MKKDDHASLMHMTREHGGKVAHGLIGLLTDPDETTKWRAVKALGRAAAQLFSQDPERAKKVIRQLIWNLNEESGGIGWGMPEAFGEILTVVPDLQEEYACLLVAYIADGPCFIENETLQKGVIWGLGRLKHIEEDLRSQAIPFLLDSLKSPDPFMQGIAVWALGEMGVKEALPLLKSLQLENQMIKIFTEDALEEKPLDQWLKETIIKLNQGGDRRGRERVEMQ